MVQRAKPDLTALIFAVFIPISFAFVLVLPASRAAFLSATSMHPYFMGFVKFAFLATAGELLAGKISTGVFQFAKGAVLKAGIWGLIGIMVVLLFPIFSAGIVAAQDAGLLFGKGNFIVTAILTSVVNNLTFGIFLMGFHRVTDAMVEMYSEKERVSAMDAIASVDWQGFVSFVVCVTMPRFWIPAHSITFMLPPQYRVFLSAFLSIILGLLLTIAKRKSAQTVEV